MLGMSKLILETAWAPVQTQTSQEQSFSPHHADILHQIPKSVTTALERFNLNNHKVTIYAVCPECQFIYPPQPPQGLSSDPQYPQFCSNRSQSHPNECSAPLLRDQKPIKPFLYHNFHDYLSGLLSRSDLEEWMNKACNDLIQSKDNTPPTMSTDVWEASFL